MVGSEAFGPLTRTLRRADAGPHSVAALLDRAITARPIIDADDIAAVLHARLTRLETLPGAADRASARLIVGLIPVADGPMTEEMHTALQERQALMEERARALIDHATTTAQGWMAAVGSEPAQPSAAAEWRRQLRVVAAYRDRYSVVSESPLGNEAASTNQQHDAALAAQAIERARRCIAVRPTRSNSGPERPVMRSGPSR